MIWPGDTATRARAPRPEGALKRSSEAHGSFYFICFYYLQVGEGRRASQAREATRASSFWVAVANAGPALSDFFLIRRSASSIAPKTSFCAAAAALAGTFLASCSTWIRETLREEGPEKK